MHSPHAIQERLERIERLLGDVERLPDQTVRDQVQEILQGLLEYHGAGLARIIELVEQKAPGATLGLAGDELAASLLLLHDLHPVELSARVEAALAEVRPFLQSHGGEVELLAVDGGVVRLKMHGSCHGCPSSLVTLRTRIEQAIYKAAPDVAGVEVEGVTDQAEAPAPAGFVPLDALAPINERLVTALVNGK